MKRSYLTPLPLSLPPGLWYVRIRGDVLGAVNGTVLAAPRAAHAAAAAAAAGKAPLQAALAGAASGAPVDPATLRAMPTVPQWGLCVVRASCCPASSRRSDLQGGRSRSVSLYVVSSLLLPETSRLAPSQTNRSAVIAASSAGGRLRRSILSAASPAAPQKQQEAANSAPPPLHPQPRALNPSRRSLSQYSGFSWEMTCSQTDINGPGATYSGGITSNGASACLKPYTACGCSFAVNSAFPSHVGDAMCRSGVKAQFSNWGICPTGTSAPGTGGLPYFGAQINWQSGVSWQERRARARMRSGFVLPLRSASQLSKLGVHVP